MAGSALSPGPRCSGIRAGCSARCARAPGRWLWLVRPGTAEAAAAFALVLLDALPGLLVRARHERLAA